VAVLAFPSAALTPDKREFSAELIRDPNTDLAL
jgi:hypothetical protein